MKYLKLFESFEDIDSICEKYRIKDYTINEDGSIDVNGNVYLSSPSWNKGLTELPLKFRNVSGNFHCYNNKLSTLEGSPKTVGGEFHCSSNKITSLKGYPESTGCDDFLFHDNLRFHIVVQRSLLKFVHINSINSIHYQTAIIHQCIIINLLCVVIISDSKTRTAVNEYQANGIRVINRIIDCFPSDYYILNRIVNHSLNYNG